MGPLIDVTVLAQTLAGKDRPAVLETTRVPVMAIQTTYSNEQRERRPMRKGQTTPYLEMLRARIPSVRIEIVEDTGHFPQIDESGQTNALLDNFFGSLSAR